MICSSSYDRIVQADAHWFDPLLPGCLPYTDDVKHNQWQCEVSKCSYQKNLLKGELCGFGEEIHTPFLNHFFNLQNQWGKNTQSEVFVFLHKWTNKLFSEENKVPRTLSEARKRWQGLPHVNNVKQDEIVFVC